VGADGRGGVMGRKPVRRAWRMRHDSRREPRRRRGESIDALCQWYTQKEAGLRGSDTWPGERIGVLSNAASLLCTSQRRPGSSLVSHCFPRPPTAMKQAVCGADRCTLMRPTRHMHGPLRLIVSAPQWGASSRGRGGERERKAWVYAASMDARKESERLHVSV
jgi:hypothetical protein